MDHLHTPEIGPLEYGSEARFSDKLDHVCTYLSIVMRVHHLQSND